MGLDICHYKATLKRPNTLDPFEINGMTEEHFCEFDVPFSHFERYIQEIDFAKIVTSVIVADREDFAEDIRQNFDNKEPYVFSAKDDEELGHILHAHETENGLLNLNKYYQEGYLKGGLFPMFRRLYYYDIEKVLGFYETEVGYQRKGINENFRHFYQEGKTNFVLHEEFERAYECIDFYWDSDTEEDVIRTRENFKKNFLDNYELGASYLSLCY